MFINHRRDGDIWQRAMDRDNLTAFAAMAAGAADLAANPIPDENPNLAALDVPIVLNSLGVEISPRCKHGPETFCWQCDEDEEDRL